MRASKNVLVLPLVLLAALPPVAAGRQRSRTHICSEPNPASICTPSNTCGSASEPCNIDVKRGANSASARAVRPGAKENALVCVAAGTTVNWQSSSKNTGFILDFGGSSPFSAGGAITGGSDRSVSLKVEKEGCYKFSIGACSTDAIYGMCAEGSSELIVIGATPGH